MAILRKPNLVRVSDNPTARNFDVINDFLSVVAQQAIMNGLILQDLEFGSAGVYRVEHGLGREPTGFFTVKKNANVDLWQVADPELSASQELKTLYLPVQINGAATLSLLVF